MYGNECLRVWSPGLEDLGILDSQNNIWTNSSIGVQDEVPGFCFLLLVHNFDIFITFGKYCNLRCFKNTSNITKKSGRYRRIKMNIKKGLPSTIY